MFPWYEANTCAHNSGLLTQYYTKKQHKHYSNLINAHFATEQQQDTRYVTPATIIPMAHISIHECNPERDIETSKILSKRILTLPTYMKRKDDTSLPFPKPDYIGFGNNTNSHKTPHLDYNHLHNHSKPK